MTVYLITNLINEKVYVGITKGLLSKRWIQHKSDAKRNSQCPIHRAIRKYGAEYFKIEAIETCNSTEELYARESAIIQIKKSTDSELGYNASLGGESGKSGVKSWNSGITKNENSLLMSASVNQTGEKNSFFGKTHSDEQKSKWSKQRAGKKREARPDLVDSNRKRVWSDESRKKLSLSNGISIFCINNDSAYPSISEACRQLNLDHKSVTRVLKGEFKQTKGYRFSYLKNSI